MLLGQMKTISQSLSYFTKCVQKVAPKKKKIINKKREKNTKNISFSWLARHLPVCILTESDTSKRNKYKTKNNNKFSTTAT